MGLTEVKICVYFYSNMLSGQEEGMHFEALLEVFAAFSGCSSCISGGGSRKILWVSARKLNLNPSTAAAVEVQLFLGVCPQHDVLWEELSCEDPGLSLNPKP